MPNLSLLSQVRLQKSLTDFADEYPEPSQATNFKEIRV